MQQNTGKQKASRTKHTEDILRVLARNSIVGVYIVQDGKFVFTNSMFQNYVGYSEEDLIGMDPLSIVYPDDRDMVRENAMKMLKGELSSTYEFRYMKKSGEILWITESVASIRYQRKKATLGIFTDNTQRKQTEEKYRQLLDDTNDGYAVTQEGKVLFANRRFGEIFGYDLTQVLGKSIDRLMLPDYRQALLELYERVMCGDEAPPEGFEAVMMRKDGTPITVEANIKLIDYEGKPAAYVIFRDITEHKRAGEQIDHRLKIEKAITRISRLFITYSEVDLDEVLRNLGEVVSANRAFVFQFRQNGRKLENTHEWCSPGTKPRIDHLRDIDSEVFSWWIKKLNAGENVIVLDINSLPDDVAYEKKILQSQNIRSLLMVPIYKTSGIFAGFMGLDDTVKDRQWSDDDASLLRVVAEMLAGYWERKQAEDKYKQLLDDIIDGYIVVQDGNCVFANRRFCEMFDYRPEQIPGEALASFIAPDNRHAVLQRYERLMNGEEDIPAWYEGLAIKKDGTTIVAEVYANTINYEDKPAFAAIVRDITARKRTEAILRESEEKLRLIIESVPEGIIVSNLSGEILDVNDSLVRMHGYDHKDKLIGQKCFTLIAERERARVINDIKRLLKVGSNGVSQYTFVRNDGSKFSSALSAALLRGSQGQPVGFVAIVVDTTEQQKMQEQLMLTDRLASIGQLAAGIAHELSNPLTGVIGLSKLLLEKNISDEVKEDLVLIDGEAQRAVDVVKGLLTFARNKGTEKTLVDINKIIQDVLQLRSYEHSVSNIEVEPQFASDLPHVIASAAQMQQVFMNLIVNAEQAMLEAHRRGKLKVTTQKIGGMVRACISDDGPGISPENMKELFNPFFTTKEVGKGTGLGLSISHGIVTEHGGNIYAESEPGEGATFIVELPVKELVSVE